MSACVSVCPCVCSLLRYHLNVFLPQLPKDGCQNFLEIWISWGKVVERNGLRFENVCSKWSKIAAAKFFYYIFFNCSLLRYRLNLFLPPLCKVVCPNFFRDLESLGKSNGKKWSQEWSTIAAAKKVFYRFFPLCSLHLKILLPPPPPPTKQKSKLFLFS